MDKLEELGIVKIQNLPAADATSGNASLQVEVGEKEPKRLAKMEDIMWKFNILMFVLAVIGCVFVYIAMKLK